VLEHATAGVGVLQRALEAPRGRHRRPGSCTCRLVIVLTFSVGLLTGVPAAGLAKARFQTGTYKGRTSQSHAITFGADSRHLRGLDTVVFAFCIYPGEAHHELHRVRPNDVISIGNRKFSKNVSLYDGGSAQITGKLKGPVASGSMKINYLISQGSPTLGTYEVGSCTGHMTWTAKWKKRSYPPNLPKVQPPATPGASFTGQTADGDAVSFLTTADGKHVYNLDTHYNYSCLSGATGQLHMTDGSQEPINDATGYFGFTADLPVTGLTDDAQFLFTGSFNTQFDSSGHVHVPGSSATGSMQVSFSTTSGDSCLGNAAWSAHA
jgi:hypothetical protein